MKRVYEGVSEKRVVAPRTEVDPERLRLLGNLLFGKYSPAKAYLEFNAARDPKYLNALLLLCQQTRREFTLLGIQLKWRWNIQRDSAARFGIAVTWNVKAYGEGTRWMLDSLFQVSKHFKERHMQWRDYECGMRALPVTWVATYGVMYVPVAVHAETGECLVMTMNGQYEFDDSEQVSRWWMVDELAKWSRYDLVTADGRAPPGFMADLKWSTRQNRRGDRDKVPQIGAKVGWDAYWHNNEIIVK